MTKCALYLRVSKTEQETDNQLPSLESYAKARGWEITEVYAEEASAWRNGHQRELGRLLDDLRSGKRRYDHVLVWALDRLSRQGPLHVLTLLDTFKTLGAPIISLQEPWSDAPFSDAMFSLVAWVARFESERRSERTKAGLERVKAQGVKLGRPPGSKDKERRRRSGYNNRWQRSKQTPALV
jgi:putative DNA-invertase from lambdoid prophage Rac